jgi:hypothetical protein
MNKHASHTISSLDTTRPKRSIETVFASNLRGGLTRKLSSSILRMLREK